MLLSVMTIQVKSCTAVHVHALCHNDDIHCSSHAIIRIPIILIIVIRILMVVTILQINHTLK